MIKAVIIDDEENTREVLTGVLNLKCKDVEVVGYGKDVKSGIEAINKYKPDVVLLDIKMPDGTGFDLLLRIKAEAYNFHVIFITAYEEYALKAFRFSAIDYLLKPIDPNELYKAIEKCKTMHKDEFKQKMETFSYNSDKQGENKKIVLKTQDAIHIVKVNDIIRCESDGGYTTFFTVNNGKIMVSHSIKDFEELFEEFGFFRIHQSHLLNLAFVKRFDKREGGYVIMSDESVVPVSRRKKDAFLTIINEI